MFVEPSWINRRKAADLHILSLSLPPSSVVEDAAERRKDDWQFPFLLSLLTRVSLSSLSAPAFPFSSACHYMQSFILLLWRGFRRSFSLGCREQRGTHFVMLREKSTHKFGEGNDWWLHKIQKSLQYNVYSNKYTNILHIAIIMNLVIPYSNKLTLLTVINLTSTLHPLLLN